MTNIHTQSAKLRHAKDIHQLLTIYSDDKILLSRTISDIYQSIPQFFVTTDNTQVTGCVSLEIFTKTLGEVRSLAVHPDYQHQHLGSHLLQTVETYALELGIKKLMALTYVDNFFHKHGYQTVKMSSLPEKVWRVCVKCPNFHHCEEIPVVKNL